MILPDSSGLLPHEEPDEDKTVLTCLTAKAISESCNVVAHVLDKENVSHLQRANANEIVVPDEHPAKRNKNETIDIILFFF